MTLPTEGFPLAAAVSPRLQVVATTDSTNADLLRDAAADVPGHPHLSVLLTDDQRAGRGRLDRSWTTPPGTALAVSVLVRVPGIPASARGWIPLCAGAAMVRALAEVMSGRSHDVRLKWPNDVLLDGGKVCGILAEVVPGDADAVVIGAGVNTAMREADLPVPTATSFAAVGVDVDLDDLLARYLTVLDDLLRRLAAADGDATASGVAVDVEQRCDTIGREVAVSLPDGGVLRGQAVRLDPAGQLVVDVAGVETAVSAGDVVHVR
ncbi:biotin--[acetyl-CoA-carboxylase] ligase [Microbacterium sp. zg.Y1090]|uniref:biotin--[acetyl-CoA-carboxylase] ligase n=1 Tax=Microbacterium TaxID=33882 RepID=UPI00214C830C|nr:MULTISPECIES: biotin--[acetyl-CoA-carboxylase] ligase [unclassified Microbacterium]MCR2813620.1 biotin--[acetyl-CoA-carboxylase] ligase [Microbacterium sp. zg.Y1084]MCR2818047.1 biotin--[acetyl-CoA-carboxylase] ligase [Microbacterium sp. zg.Y1090]MDL5486565.1 biotin--[acetyl-CoA-carboxylase] ligase [Microbacterium sp. zg-Y1211]WIM27794.1 biotin--[acetyl-CoA-carboxylase] ligase [Microbacterium sp. zg-Y1090]